jgi:large repetitive protein
MGRLRAGILWFVVVAALLIAPATAGALNQVSFSPGPTMSTGRDYPGAARLPDGRVLVLGGYTTAGDYLDSTEIYDPATNSFSPGPTMPSKLYAPAVASLPDGMVLIAGGYDGGANTSSAWVFNPNTGTFSPVGSLHVARELANAAPLPDGRVLIVGGYSNASESINSTEIFDPATNTFSVGPTYPQAAYGVAAVPIAGNRVLTAGGYDSHGGHYLSTAFAFAGSTFSPVGSLPFHNYAPAGAPLPGGRALLAGGYDETSADGYLTSALIFDPVTGSFSSNGISSLSHAREEAAAVELKDGRVLVVGGWDGQALTSTEILSVPSNSFSAKVKGRKVTFNVSNEGFAETTDKSTEVATTAKKKKAPKLVKTTSKHGGPGKISVKVRLTKQGSAKLRQKGKLKVRVVYTPDQGISATKKLKLRSGK